MTTLSGLVKNGNRGRLSGYSILTEWNQDQLALDQGINYQSPEEIVVKTSGPCTIKIDGQTGLDGTVFSNKVLILKSTGKTTLSWSFSGNVFWSNGGEEPEWGSAENKTLILTITYVGDRVILNTFHNDDI